MTKMIIKYNLMAPTVRLRVNKFIFALVRLGLATEEERRNLYWNITIG